MLLGNIMTNVKQTYQAINTLSDLKNLANYSFVEALHPDPDAKKNGIDHSSREVFSGHYVLVAPTPIENPIYISHSKELFKELTFGENLVTSEEFIRLFSGDSSLLPNSLRKLGWATGYALSIYGTEYYEQCPFKTGNGYGDGRAISILEVLINGKRWEMQLKGGGKTSYCRGADGRAVLRSSIREFLAQEHMNALGIPTSRSLCLYTSKTETVKRPWFLNRSYSRDPEVMIEESVAITTRVASSFLRVGQLELFARRARKNEHPKAIQELEMIVSHLIDREYSEDIDRNLPLEKKIILLAKEFSFRLTSLIVNWIRVGYCQGNFNSDNCAAGGFTLDYGPFGFIDMFDPQYQPWTGGGVHFSFFNQPNAAMRNYQMFCKALQPLLKSNQKEIEELQNTTDKFSNMMKEKMEQMWASKLGFETYNDEVFNELMKLMIETDVDYTIFFRELSNIPDDIDTLTKSFYGDDKNNAKLLERWSMWLTMWRSYLNVTTLKSKEKLSNQMKQINPKYTLREWFLLPAYKEAQKENYTLIKELQEIMNDPYSEHTSLIEEKYYRLKPLEFFEIAGISHVSCSS